MAPWWAWSHASPSSGWSGRAPRLAILPAIEPIPSRGCHVESAVADEKAEVRRQTNSRQQFLPLSFRAEREISQRDPSGLACVRARIQAATAGAFVAPHFRAACRCPEVRNP